MVEHLVYTEGVKGSSPLLPTKRIKSGGVAQLVRAIACHAIGRGFESLHSRHFIRLRVIIVIIMAGVTGLEPATYRVTGDRSNQLSYTPLDNFLVGSKGLEPLTPSV